MFNMKQLIGFHVSKEWFRKDISNILKFSKIIQIFATNPRMMVLPKKESIQEIIKECARAGMAVVFHGPYTTNMVRARQDTYEYTLSYIQRFYEIIDDLLNHNSDCICPVSLVLHTQHPDKGVLVHQTMKRFMIFLSDANTIIESYLNLFPFSLSIETGCSSLSLPVSKYLLDKTVSLPQSIGVCLDTEHIWASGFPIVDLREIYNLDWSKISVVHLNAIPAKVKQGSGRDLHGQTPLTESQGSMGWVETIIHICKSKMIPIILERSDQNVICEDLRYISSVWNKL